MKVVCIDVSGIRPDKKDYYLTFGRWYEAKITSPTMCVVQDDSGKSNSYMRSRFKLLEDIRQEKLEELGIW